MEADPSRPTRRAAESEAAAADELICDGVHLDSAGVVHVDPSLERPLCDLAIELQDGGLAVDVEHVLAALVMAARAGQLDPSAHIGRLTSEQRRAVNDYIEAIFRQYGDKPLGDS